MIIIMKGSASLKEKSAGITWVEDQGCKANIFEGVEHMVERHELGLFERSEMEAAFADAGLTVRYDEQGLTGRGLWIGTRA